jgi:hypothetical protein
MRINFAALVFIFGISFCRAVPQFSATPVDAVATVGTYASFNVSVATARLPLSYQWKKDGILISGAMRSDYTISAVRATDAGTYTVVATDADGAIESPPAVLTVRGAADTGAVFTISLGATAELNGAADNSDWLPAYLPAYYLYDGAPTALQWFFGRQAIPGPSGTWQSLGLETLETYGPGDYYAVVSTPAGRTATQTLHVTGSLTPMPQIIRQPNQLIDVTPGTSFGLYITSNVSPQDATFLWQKNGKAVWDGATSLNISRATVDDAGDYTVKITNAKGTVISHPTHVTVSSAGSQPILTSVTGDSQQDPRYDPGYGGISAKEPILGATIYRNGTLIPSAEYQIGENSVTVTWGTVGAGPVNVYTGSITTASGTTEFPTFTISYLDAGLPPRIVFQTGGGAGTQTLQVRARGEWPLTFEWSKDGQPVTTSWFDGSHYYASEPGTYSVRITNAHGSVTSQPMRIDALPDFTGSPRLPVSVKGRLKNLSARGLTKGSASPLIAGFVIGGTGSKRVLVRAAGPSLSAYNVAQPLPNPNLRLVTLSGTSVATNEDWADTAASDITAAGNSVGAFAFGAGSKDAALITTLDPGAYTAIVTGGGDGIALVEVYDLDADDSPTELSNLSARGYTGPGEQVLIAGASVTRVGLRNYLWRAVGPTLRDYGVTDAVSAATLNVIDSSSRTVASNASWATSPDVDSLRATSDSVYAFPLHEGSLDAAAVLPMVGSTWTALAGAPGGVHGTVLVEIYAAP